MASHIAKRPIHRWVREVLHWQPVGKGGSAVEIEVGRENWKCIVVTIGWFIWRWQHKSMNFGSNRLILICFSIFGANELQRMKSLVAHTVYRPD